MDFSLKEAFGLIIALVCTALVIFSLFSVSFFKKADSFINATTDNTVVEVKEPTSK